MSDILLFFQELKTKYHSTNKIIITNKLFTQNYDNIKFIVPKIGDKKKILELAKKNIIELKHNLILQQPLEKDFNSLLEKVRIALKLKKTPYHIECFDNSNIQGYHAVSSCVVFKNGSPSKNDYRHFKIQTVIGPNDYKTMEEVILRRYKYNTSLPDLIIIDGGKGQLHAATKVLKDLNIINKLEICSIAKRNEEIFFENIKKPITLQYNSDELKFIQYIRDEAHNFAITFHRKVRNKNFIKK